MARPFVSHLTKIDLDNEELLRAVDHFIQFGIEKHRLTLDGAIPENEWGHRGDRLCDRWTNVRTRAIRNKHSKTSLEVGQMIYEETTYNHLEPLAGEACSEIYMTAGHYHRLADEDIVWWHPDHVGEAKAAE